jgi:hypothetical protein
MASSCVRRRDAWLARPTPMRALALRSAILPGSYVYVAFGANPCPAKTAQIVDVGTCQTAAFAAGVSLRVETDRRRPKGCYTATYATIAETNMSFVFNSDPIGLSYDTSYTSDFGEYRVLCAVPTGTPARVRTGRVLHRGTQGSAALVSPVPLHDTG